MQRFGVQGRVLVVRKGVIYMEILVGLVVFALFTWGVAKYEEWAYARRMQKKWEEYQKKCGKGK